MKVTSIYRKDKVGTLTHGSGNINMTSSILTIGGLQYDTEGARSVALPTMTANTRYQIYAVVSGGDVILVVSQNENSVGPSGYSSWKLVGSIYSNGLASVGFGSFVNITGCPKTSSIDSGPISITGSITNPTKGTINTDSSSWHRDGDLIVYRMQFEQSAAGAGGSGDYRFSLPLNINANAISYVNPLTVSYGVFSGRLASGIDHYVGHVSLIDSTRMIAYIQFQRESGTSQGGGIVSSTVASLGVASIQYGMNNIRIPVQGWSNTAIEDL